MRYEQIKEIIDKNDPSTLLGLVEGQHFDAKSQPYIFKSDDSKHEYAKDLVSFLNAEGGFILLGGETQISPVHSGEEVSELKWFPKALFVPQSYRDLILEWIYPVPIGIEFHIYSSEDDKILCLIEIPNQESSQRPYLIAKSQLEEGAKVDHHIVGWARRFSDRTTRVGRTDIHRWFQSGMMLEDKLGGQLSRILNILENKEAKTLTSIQVTDLPEGQSVTTPQDTSAVRSNVELSLKVADRIGEGVAGLETEGERFLAIAMYPIGDNHELASIFESRRSPIVNLMTNPPILRQTGWDINSGLNPKIVNGNFLRANEDGRRILDVYRDGATVFVGRINENLLAWGSKTNIRIHPLALIETVRSLMAFYGELLKHFAVYPSKVGIALRLGNMHLNSEPCLLGPPATSSFGFEHPSDYKSAPKDVLEMTLNFDTDRYDVDAVAYQVVREIYIWFGFTEDVVPYTEMKGDKKAINTTQIAQIR